ncbi:hypothetical protein CBL_01563 [Carabus blaptoides fortunei]
MKLLVCVALAFLAVAYGEDTNPAESKTVAKRGLLAPVISYGYSDLGHGYDGFYGGLHGYGGLSGIGGYYGGYGHGYHGYGHGW